MKKMSVLEAEMLFEEEKETRRLIENPYWGLKCNRGLWLTRFPKGSLPKDPKFTMAYVKAGGGFDSVGYWGIEPSHLKELELQGWSLEEVSLLGHGVPEYLCRFDGVTPENWKILERGIKRAEALKKMGVESSCSNWTLGRLPIEKFIKRLFKNGVKVTFRCNDNTLEINHLLEYRHSFEKDTYYGKAIAVEALSEGSMGRHLYNVEQILPKKLLTYCRRCTDLKSKTWMSSDSSFVFSSLKAAKIFTKLARFNTWGFESLRAGDINIYGSKTSCGYVFHLHSKKLLLIDAPMDDNAGFILGDEKQNNVPKTVFSIRQITGFNISKLQNRWGKDVWFVWKEGKPFSEHIESSGQLRDVIEMAKKREKRKSLVLSLNDVRNDRTGTVGFCLAGTKSFLSKRMPFVYRMVAQYKNWGDIPEEIMSTEWQLASRDIFDGYPSPVIL